MNLDKFTGPGSTLSRRKFWDKARDTVLSLQKQAGRNVSVSEHKGMGTLINVTRERGPTCCNREVTEISTMTLHGTFTMDCGLGLKACEFNRTWTRIDHTVPFNDVDDQFWFWLANDPGTCNNMQAVFNQPDFLHPTAVCQDLPLTASVDLNEFLIFPGVGDTFDIVMQFFVAASNVDTGAQCNGNSTEFDIPVTACDVSGLLGDRVFTKACDNLTCHFEIEGHVIFA